MRKVFNNNNENRKIKPTSASSDVALCVSLFVWMFHLRVFRALYSTRTTHHIGRHTRGLFCCSEMCLRVWKFVVKWMDEWQEILHTMHTRMEKGNRKMRDEKGTHITSYRGSNQIFLLLFCWNELNGGCCFVSVCCIYFNVFI